MKYQSVYGFTGMNSFLRKRIILRFWSHRPMKPLRGYLSAGLYRFFPGLVICVSYSISLYSSFPACSYSSPSTHVGASDALAMFLAARA